MRPLGRSSFLRDVQKIREKRLFVANLEVIEPIAAADAVMKAFREKDVVLMRADWTNQDPEITRAL